MDGHVDNNGRALVIVTVRSFDSASAAQIEAWIDTGFIGDLLIPRQQITALGLSSRGFVIGELADGSKTVMPRFVCEIDWFGRWIDAEVIAGDGQIPLLGIGLLADYDLHVSYRSGTVRID